MTLEAPPRLAFCDECQLTSPPGLLEEVELLTVAGFLPASLCPDCLRAQDEDPEAAPAHRPGPVRQFAAAERAARLLSLGYTERELSERGVGSAIIWDARRRVARTGTAAP